MAQATFRRTSSHVNNSRAIEGVVFRRRDAFETASVWIIAASALPRAIAKFTRWRNACRECPTWTSTKMNLKIALSIGRLLQPPG
jgi:hypothetical protein